MASSAVACVDTVCGHRLQQLLHLRLHLVGQFLHARRFRIALEAGRMIATSRNVLDQHNGGLLVARET